MNAVFLRRLSPLVLLPLIGASPATPSLSNAPAPVPVHGEYVEARTASVFAGACHYNGERVTEGRSVVMAWNVTGGSFNGVDLTGVKIAAAVVCDDNLAEPAAARKSEIVVDAKTDQQSTAAAAWVKAKIGDGLGSLTSVRRSAVSFRHDADEFVISAKGLGEMDVQPMPDNACCSQPHLVWYQPLMPLKQRRVGYTEQAAYTGHAGDPWQRSDENSAFYGTFE